MDEYIRREEAKRYFSLNFGSISHAVIAARLLDEIPTADVAPVRHGRWEKSYKSGTTVEDGYVSTCCDLWNERRTKYCPNCGAIMDGGSE